MCRRHVKYSRGMIAAASACVDCEPIAAAGRFPDSASVWTRPAPSGRRSRGTRSAAFGSGAKLDAVFFHLYGVTDREDVCYVYSTFPIVERQKVETYGRYRSRDQCLAYMNALAAGRPDAEPEI